MSWVKDDNTECPKCGVRCPENPGEQFYCPNCSDDGKEKVSLKEISKRLWDPY
ncbi:MAG: hypothetical protein ACXAC8_04475 [Candidatus Hodarchaeales archaeon]|jgi:ribosomal protein S27AE